MSSPVARYESFLINNVSTISTLESSLRSVTWFLPGRFKDAELASEARQLLSFTSIPVSDIISPLVSASLNVMSLYHDTLLARITQSDPKYKPLIPTSLHTRYTRAWSDKNYRYKWAARALELVRFTELVIEMGLRRKVSSRNKWRAIVLLEVLKCVISLYIRPFIMTVS
jgi:peroxin-16